MIFSMNLRLCLSVCVCVCVRVYLCQCLLYETLPACNCGDGYPTEKCLENVSQYSTLSHSCRGNLIDGEDLVVPVIGCKRETLSKS